jgi:hypothetical protein
MLPGGDQIANDIRGGGVEIIAVGDVLRGTGDSELVQHLPEIPETPNGVVLIPQAGDVEQITDTVIPDYMADQGFIGDFVIIDNADTVIPHAAEVENGQAVLMRAPH